MQLVETDFMSNIDSIVFSSRNIVVKTKYKERVIDKILKMQGVSVLKVSTDSVEELRDTVLPASSVRSEGGVILFTGFDSPSEIAQQFLLKILEDMKDTRLIFVTKRLNYLQTLRSRCSLFELVGGIDTNSLSSQEVKKLVGDLTDTADAKADKLSNDQKRDRINNAIEELLKVANLSADKIESLLLCKKALNLNCNIKLIASQIIWSYYT